MTERHPDQPAAWAQKTEFLVSGFRRYRAALAALPPESHRPFIAKPNIACRSNTFATIVDAWATGVETHLDFMLTNEVNRFGEGLQGLLAWAEVLDAAGDDEKLEWLLEFVAPLAVCVLNSPFALKNRFMFAAIRISDEANRLCRQAPIGLEATSDDMAEAPKWQQAWRYVKPWSAHSELENAVASICPKPEERSGRVETYRDQFVHRIPHYIGMGVRASATLQYSDSNWTVQYKEAPPLELREIVRELGASHEACRTAHAALCKLVTEQWQAIQKALPRN